MRTDCRRWEGYQATIAIIRARDDGGPGQPGRMGSEVLET